MQPLGLALKARGQEGEALPGAIQRLDDIGVKFRKGQLSMIAAAPGGGKSSLALYMVTRMSYDEFSGVPVMYFSADTDRVTVAKTIMAGLTQKTLDEVERLILAEDEATYRSFDRATDHIWWNFEPSPTLHDIREEIEAYAYAMGEYPHMIVVDNLMDVAEDGEEYGKLSDVILNLNDIARIIGAHVMVLHHVTGAYTDGNAPIPRSALLQKIDKKPRMILTLHKVQDGVMGIRVVKNSTGVAYTNGSFGIDIGWLAERGWFSD